MPKTMTITVYQYDELPTEKAKERAREWFKISNAELGNVRDKISDDMKETLSSIGLGDCKPQFAMNYCQGDGASFYGTIDVVDFVHHQRAILKSIEDRQHYEVSRYDLYRDVVPDDLKAGDMVYSTYETASEGKGRVVLSKDSGKIGQRIVSIAREGQHTYIVRSYGAFDEKHAKKLLDRLNNLSIGPEALDILDEWRDDEIWPTIKVLHHGDYYHWNSMYIEMDTDWYGLRHDEVVNQAKAMEPGSEGDKQCTERLKEIESHIDRQFDDLRMLFGEFAKSVGKQLENDGYATREGEESDEQVSENIRANEYWFTASGSRSVTVDADPNDANEKGTSH